MTDPFYSNGVATLHEADARSLPLADQSVHCAITSPPYWGLRNYGIEGGIGSESTIAEYTRDIVEACAEVWRVLRDDGTFWLNVGDSYAANCSYQVPDSKHRDVGNAAPMRVPSGYKPKDLIGQPWRVAFALQESGWFLRSAIVWHKPNPMPESVRDRPTSAYEMVFLLSKKPRYFYDGVPLRTPLRDSSPYKTPDGWDTSTGQGGHGAFHRNGREKGRIRKTDKQRGHTRRHAGFNDRWDAMSKPDQQAKGANARNVWKIPTQGRPEAHFATFPDELARRCILAGTSEYGVCGVCGAPYRRTKNGERWESTCKCSAPVVPATVFDPFIGSGTVCHVAQQLGRHSVGVDLNPDYLAIAQKRLESEPVPMPGLLV